MTYAGDGQQTDPEQPAQQLPPEQVAQVQPEWPQPQADPYGQQPMPFAQQPLQPPPVKAKKTGLVVVSVLAVLFLAGTAVFGGLYLSEKSDHDAVSTQLATTSTQLAAAKKTVSDREDSLSAALKSASDSDAKAQSYQACHDAAVAFDNAVIGSETDAEITELGTKMIVACH